MKVIKLKGYNVVYAENQPEYLKLPAHKTHDGRVTSCWKLSFIERATVMLTGKIYLQTLTFNQPLQPLKMVIKNPLRRVKEKAIPGPIEPPRPKNYSPVG